MRDPSARPAIRTRPSRSKTEQAPERGECMLASDTHFPGVRSFRCPRTMTVNPKHNSAEPAAYIVNRLVSLIQRSPKTNRQKRYSKTHFKLSLSYSNRDRPFRSRIVDGSKWI